MTSRSINLTQDEITILYDVIELVRSGMEYSEEDECYYDGPGISFQFGQEDMDMIKSILNKLDPKDENMINTLINEINKNEEQKGID